METQQAIARPRPAARGIHRLGRVLVVGYYTALCLAATGILAGAVAMGVFGAFTAAPDSVATLHWTMPARMFLVTGGGLLALSGLVFAAWGLLQALYPAMFVPTMRRYFDPFMGQWPERLAARSSGTTVHAVFDVCRRLRFWGFCAIPFGLAVSMDALGLALSLNQNTLAQISSALPFSSSLLVLATLVPVFTGRDSCWNRRAVNQVLAENQRDGDN